jgi:hypothetical protein
MKRIESDVAAVKKMLKTYYDYKLEEELEPVVKRKQRNENLAALSDADK